MKAKKEHKQVFTKLRKETKDSFSINEFCEQKGINLSELKLLAEDNEKFYQTLEEVISKIFDNASEAYVKNEISRSKLGEYLKEVHGFDDPEWVINSIEYESGWEDRNDLVKKMENVENDPEASLEAAFEIMDKYKYRNTW